ncbi:MAG: AAA family ATPase [Bacteroidales bacterium]|nr:AAA family ATPase [Bacteroidales bacterium]
MAFYLEKAIFNNRAPFKHLEIDYKKNGISVLTAINGKGKTTILSHITDALYELARKVFHNDFEGKENKYYRVSSSLFNIDGNNPSFVYLRFNLNGENIDYVDIRNKCTKEQYESVINLNNKITFEKITNAYADSYNIKLWSINDKRKIENEIFAKSILTYFPSYRYETPSYLNDPYDIKLDYAIKTRFSGSLQNQIEVVSNLPTLANWILDVLLDMELHKETRFIKDGDKLIPITIPAQEQTFVWNNLNKIISGALSSKHYSGSVRLGIGARNSGASRIAVMNDINVDGKRVSEMICPSIFNLSSGELSLVSIFGEILRQSDNLKNNIPLNDIQGIVLIDEVDKHLHITLQKEVLPKLFNLFPNVQFIVSSHSPFLNMGLADEASARTQIIDLDNNGIICEPTKNDLFTEVYDIMVNENQRFYSNYQKLQGELDAITKPIVITEGKTDIMHILKAKEKLGIALEFDTISPDNQPDGDSNLQDLLKQLCKVKHDFKVIAIFDRDISKTVQTMNDNGTGYKSYGNNVYGFCISAPQSRIDNGQDDISIEYLPQFEIIKSKLKYIFKNIGVVFLP